MPKKNPNTDEHEFKVPLAPAAKGSSLLGLDKLAAQKKKERLENQNQTRPAKTNNDEQPSSKRSKVYSYKDGEEDAQQTPDFRAYSIESNDTHRINNIRYYREREKYYDDNKTPTPHRSHHEKISRHRDAKYHDRKGLYASTNGNFIKIKKSERLQRKRTK